MAEEKNAEAQQAAPEKSEGNKEASSQVFAMAKGQGGIIGIKAGMTQIYNEDGEMQAVTVIDCQPNIITQVKNLDKEGYVALQVGLVPKREVRCNKAERGHNKKTGAKGFRHYQEFRLPAKAKLDGAQLGQALSLEAFKEGDLVDVTSYSKGKGFQGTMKRHNYSGLPRTHGVSVSHRSLGSTGNRASPGRTFKNKGMPGHMGNRRVTLQNSRILRVDTQNNLILIHGSVPGSKAGLVTIKPAAKHNLQGNK